MSASAGWLDVLEGRARWALLQGDNAEVLPQLPDRSAAHVITDPPYEAEAHTLQRRAPKDTRALRNEALSFAPISEAERDEAARAFLRVSQRWQVVFCQVEAAVRWSQALVDAGAKPKRIGVWIKPDAMPQFTGDRPGMGYESIVFTHVKGRSRWNGGGRVAVFTHNKNSGGAHLHETQKPLPLMLELVELFTDPDDVVLDPFAGSGTTGVACLRLGRRFIGVEKDPAYAQLARDRLIAEAQGLSLTDLRRGQQSLFGETA